MQRASWQSLAELSLDEFARRRRAPMAAARGTVSAAAVVGLVRNGLVEIASSRGTSPPPLLRVSRAKFTRPTRRSVSRRQRRTRSAGPRAGPADDSDPEPGSVTEPGSSCDEHAGGVSGSRERAGRTLLSRSRRPTRLWRHGGSRAGQKVHDGPLFREAVTEIVTLYGEGGRRV